MCNMLSGAYLGDVYTYCIHHVNQVDSSVWHQCARQYAVTVVCGSVRQYWQCAAVCGSDAAVCGN
jgi:hypothetical protein